MNEIQNVEQQIQLQAGYWDSEERKHGSGEEADSQNGDSPLTGNAMLERKWDAYWIVHACP